MVALLQRMEKTISLKIAKEEEGEEGKGEGEGEEAFYDSALLKKKSTHPFPTLFRSFYSCV